jgi:hypothetical protein
VVVPNEVALQLHDFKLIVIHFGYHLGSPVLRKQFEFFPEIDNLKAHAMPPEDILCFSGKFKPRSGSQ